MRCSNRFPWLGVRPDGFQHSTASFSTAREKAPPAKYNESAKGLSIAFSFLTDSMVPQLPGAHRGIGKSRISDLHRQIKNSAQSISLKYSLLQNGPHWICLDKSKFPKNTIPLRSITFTRGIFAYVQSQSQQR